MSLSEDLRQAIRASGKPLLRISEDTGIDTGILSRFVSENPDSRRSLRLDTADKLIEYFGFQVIQTTTLDEVDEIMKNARAIIQKRKPKK